MYKKVAYIAIIVLLVLVAFFGLQNLLKSSEKSSKLSTSQAVQTVDKTQTSTEKVKDKVADIKESLKTESKPTTIESLTLKTGTKDRTYLVEKPTEKGEVKNIVVALHGEGENGERLQKTLRLSDLVSSNQTLIVYPDGLNESWNDARVKSEDVDDIGFITELIQTLQSGYSVSKENTSIIGVSNGGFMIQTLACQNDILAKNAISVVASLLGELAEQCKSFPTNSIFILGKKDTLVPYDGGSLNTPIPGTVLSAQNSLTNVGQINKCGEKSEEKESTSVLVQKITDCPNGGQVSLITYVNETHISLPIKVDLVSIIRENGLIK
jgi:polyhydroxybutyrate depolymerase